MSVVNAAYIAVISRLQCNVRDNYYVDNGESSSVRTQIGTGEDFSGRATFPHSATA